MKCPKCGSDNREGIRFCEECGAKLELECPDCKAKIPLGKKFCGECGHDLTKAIKASVINYSEPQSYTPKFLADKILTTRSSIEGERKLVTVLFADVANFTSIAEKLDPEKVHQLMDNCFKILMDEIHTYEGTINQFTGDGVMALFGAPVAHEDHAQRACFAALAIQKKMGGFDERLKAEKKIDFNLRIGINTGPVVVGSIGNDLRMDYTALGDSTNLAARMQQNAEPGKILITDSTLKLISSHFITESLGKLQIKGKEAPVTTYLLKRARGIRTLMDIAAEKGLSPLAGRSEELQRLNRLWDLAKKDQGQVVFIVGEAGIGKSRLVFEFHRSLSNERITWLEGHGTAYGTNMPFLPLTDLLKRNFRIEEGDTEQLIIQKIEEGLHRLGEEAKERAPYLKFLFSVDPGDPLIASMDPQGRRRMIFDSIRLMTIHGSRLRPLILVLEDLHWIDHDTEDYLKYVVDSLATLPVLAILTYRPAYSNPFGERTFYNRISLKALEEKETLNLAKGVIGVSKLPEFIAPLILERAEGNPFYIEEITKSFEELGAFRRVEAVEAALDLDQIQIPTSIQDILMARVDRLPEKQKNALQTAAVIGREFTARLLERIARLEDSASEILGDLVGLELIYQTQFYPELIFMFKHALTHDVVYDSLLTSKRKAIHAKVGEVIEELYSERLAEYYEILAHHCERGGVWEKAIKYLILSGQKALANMANPSAHAFFQKAIDIINQKSITPSADQKYSLFHGRGNTTFNIGRFNEAERDFIQAREVARRMGDQNKEGESLSMAGWSLANRKKFKKAMATYNEAIDFGRHIGNPIIEARNLIGLGVLNVSLGDDPQAGMQYIDKAVEIGKKIKSPLILTSALSIRAWQYAHSDIEDQEALEYCKNIIPMLKAVQNARVCVWVYITIGYAQACKGDYLASIATFQEGFKLTEETGETLNRAKIFNWLGWIYSDLGWISEARKLNQQSYQATLEFGSGAEEAEANAIVNLAENDVAEDKFEEAETCLKDLLKKAETDPGYLLSRHRWEVRLLCTLGEICLYKNETNEALNYAKKALEIAEKSLNKRGITRANRLMGDIYLTRKEFSSAEEKLKRALVLAKEVGNPPHLWKTYLAFGQLKEAQGLHQEAQRNYKEALIVTERLSWTLQDKKLRDIFLNSNHVTKIRDSLSRL
jgi:class 3 adenylate cyclase/tetratricopeptide (TPR) repeat protein